MTCTHCPRPAVARGLCATHYRRELRGSPLDAPLQPRGGLTKLEVRVPPRVLDRLRATGLSLAAAARAVLEDWAK